MDGAWTININFSTYWEVFERVEQQAQRHLSFIKQSLGLRDAGQCATKNPEGTKNTHMLSVYSMSNDRKLKHC